MDVAIAPSFVAIDAKEWNALTDGDPLVSHAFYAALETSKSIGPNTGWQNLTLVAMSNGKLVGMMPLFAKTHSYGEFVFDHAFADAYERSGLEYYPKLVAMTPFTPVQGTRIFGNDSDVQNALMEAAVSILQSNDLSSLHVNFSEQKLDHPYLLERHSVQYHFTNNGYTSFDDFLNSLTASKRKNIRRERRDALAESITIERKMGGAITTDDWTCFWACYQDTGARKWGTPYLTHEFFTEIARTLPDQILLVMAYDDGRPVAAALNFIGNDRLLGRYWGCLGEYKFLHFELSYYQAIEFAIEHKITTVEAGAQGEHKLARGYAPVILRSYHHFMHEEFQRLIERFVRDEARQLNAYALDAVSQLPFKITDQS